MAIATEDIEQLYRRCFARAMGLAVTLLHDEEDARDIVQDVFARLMCQDEARRRRTYGGTDLYNPDAFVFRSVRNACINHIGRMEARERIRRMLPLDAEMVDNVTEERIEAVRKASATLLSQREGEVVSAVFASGHSYKEAAQELGISTSAINKHIVSALKKLRKHFNKPES